MPLSLDERIMQRLDELSEREWLETNGLGGYASATLSGANTRRYHGLLVTATHPPVGRMVLLSNRFPDGDEPPEYNTVDATLWFFVAIYRYLRYTQDNMFVRDELIPVLQGIIQWHDRGTRYNIRVDSDGLLCAGTSDVQLTWMDAKIGNWVVTPRQGKAVEINALWYNALRILADLLPQFEEKLLTPYGLRTLDPEHPRYRPRCEGDPVSRDSSYHQGTVWPWLLGPFISALVRTNGAAGRVQAKSILETIATHFGDAGIGTISEIFDAAHPHTPRGCIAQAWSVAEILRAYVEEVLEEGGAEHSREEGRNGIGMHHSTLLTRDPFEAT